MSDLANFESEFAELNSEFSEMAMADEQFGDEGLQAFQQLEDELASFAEFSAEGVGAMTFDSLSAEPQADMQFLWGYLRSKVLKLLNYLVAAVRRYGPKLQPCIPTVIAAIRAYKAGQYLTALRLAYSAYRCIRNALK